MSSSTLFLLGGAAAGSFVLSAALTLVMLRVAPRIRYIDRPFGHKSHRAPMPYGGGVAVFWAAWLPIIGLLLLAHALPDDWVRERFGENMRAYLGGLSGRTIPTLAILGGGLILHILGIIDDLRPLGPYPKLLSMIAAALLVAGPGHVRVAEFAGPIGAIAITVCWIVIITNAFNFLDNMDGLSAGVAAICLLVLIVCGLLAGQVLVPGLGCLFLGAIVGFLFFNFPPAKIFMGDAGSLVVGYLLAVISVLTTYYYSGVDSRPYALFMPLAALAIPLYDFTSVVIIRLLEGRNPLRGDQRHFSHRLVERGLSRRAAVLTIYLAAAATGLGATLLPHADLRTTLTVAIMVVMVLLIIAILEAPLRKSE